MAREFLGRVVSSDANHKYKARPSEIERAIHHKVG
jgi:hypothetical protein